MTGRVLYARMAIVVLALLGLFDAAYLTRERYRLDFTSICVLENSCEQIQLSQWSTIPPGNGVPVAIVGLIGFGAILGLAVVGLMRAQLGPISLSLALLLATSCAAIVAVSLLILQIVTIGTICTWCLPSSGLAFGSWIAALLGRQRRTLGGTTVLAQQPFTPASAPTHQ